MDDVERAAVEAAERIGDPEFAGKLKGLTTEEIQLFVAALETAMRRRRLMLVGTIAALVSMVGGMVAAIWIWANRERGTFVGWVFFVPFAAAGLNMWLFGRAAKRIRIAPATPPGARRQSSPP